MLGGCHQQLDVIDRALQPSAQMCQPAVQIVERKQAEDRDAQAAGGGDQRLGDATADFRGGELFIPDEVERVHDAGDGAEQAEQRRERDEGAEHPEPFLGVIQFVGGSQLHRAEQGAVRVRDAVVDDLLKRIARIGAEFVRSGEAAFGQRIEALVQRGTAAAASELPPPQRTLDDHDERGERAEQDRPHDGAALDEEIDDEIREQ